MEVLRPRNWCQKDMAWSLERNMGPDNTTGFDRQACIGLANMDMDM